MVIDLIYVDSGGGHRAAANALADCIREKRLPWEPRLLNIQDLLDPIDFVYRYSGIRFQDLYNIMLRHGWTYASAQWTRLAHAAIRLSHQTQVGALARHWEQTPPDMVVSLIPHFNRAIRQGLDAACPGTPLVTILTDIADYPPHFWIERQEQFVICGSERAALQARQIGLAADRILRASGMILHPRFYRPMEVDRRAARESLGLEHDLPTGLVLFGGEGSMDLVTIARALNDSRLPVQLILICGRHEEAARRIRALERRIPMRVEGFVSNVGHYMALSDFFIGKPGPGSISEALAMRLPAIVIRNAKTMAHERYNADWILEQRVGLVVKSWRRVGQAVAKLLDPVRFAEHRANAARMQNRAVYEIPEMLERIAGICVERAGSSPPAAAPAPITNTTLDPAWP